MQATTQVFAGHVFVRHPKTPAAYIRLDALERIYNQQISNFCSEAQIGCGPRINRYRVKLLHSLRLHALSLQFPYAEIFKRCAARRSLLLDDLTLARAQRACVTAEPANRKATA